MIPNDKDPPTPNQFIYTPYTLHQTTERDFLQVVRVEGQKLTKSLIHKNTIALIDECVFMKNGVEHCGSSITIRLTPEIMTSTLVTNTIRDLLDQFYGKQPIEVPLETTNPDKPNYLGPYN
jgi:hypothetical protein